MEFWGHRLAKFNQNQFIGYGDITNLQYFTMAAICNFGGFLKSLKFMGVGVQRAEMHQCISALWTPQCTIFCHNQLNSF